MTAFLGVIGVVTLATITPGPNNLIVLRAAVGSGIAGAIPAILGIVTGGLAVLAVALIATSAAFASAPSLHSAISVAGAGYLAWLGIGLLRRAGSATSAPTGAPQLPGSSLPGLFTFQFLNPKCWALIMTAIAASPTGQTGWWLVLAAIFVVSSTTCLILWAAAGAALTGWLTRPRVAMWVDRAMGTILLATAITLVAP